MYFVVPAQLDDPAKPTGGNVYDHRIHRELVGRGWKVLRLAAPGSWPWPDAAAEQALARLIGGIPDGAVVLIDDLIACTVPGILIPEADRLRLVVLVHTSLGEATPGHRAADAQAREGAVLAAARYVVTTSSWTRGRLLQRYRLPADKVQVAEPGVDPAFLSPGTALGGELLCVAAVTAHKGHDVLLAALTSLVELPWRCVCVGALDREPAFVEDLRHRVAAAGIGDRITFAGVQSGGDLDRVYAAADVLVLATHGETYGMVVTEALARGLPVIATSVGGLPEALGRTRAGRRPGLLVPAGDSEALATELRRWLTDAPLRARLREAAQERRSMLSGWTAAAHRIADVLTRAAA
jgi:glycosyltransferase involved in cell wall biosynthesis